MAFSDFKSLAEVQVKFRIRAVEKDFVKAEEPLDPPSRFLQELAFARKHLNFSSSDETRRASLIFPILREVYKAYVESYMLWICEPLAYDAILNGTLDYFISTRSALGKNVVGMPLVTVVMARKNDFEIGWGQCLAAMVASQKINAQNIEEHAAFPVYGIVTDGIGWQFGKLVGDTFTENLTPFSLGDLPRLFGAIDAVFKAVQKDCIATTGQ